MDFFGWLLDYIGKFLYMNHMHFCWGDWRPSLDHFENMSERSDDLKPRVTGLILADPRYWTSFSICLSIYIYICFYLFHDLFYPFLSFSAKLCDDSWLSTHGCVENHPALLPITDPMLYTTENQARTLNQAEPQSMFSDCDVRFLDRSGMFRLQSPWTHL